MSLKLSGKSITRTMLFQNKTKLWNRAYRGSVDGMWQTEPVRTVKDYRQCLHGRQSYLPDELIGTRKSILSDTNLFVSLLDYVPDMEHFTPHLHVAKMQVSRPEYPICAFFLDKSRCVIRSWNSIGKSCDRPDRCKALPPISRRE